MSIISHSWLKQCLPGCDSQDIAELLGMDGLELKQQMELTYPMRVGWN